MFDRQLWNAERILVETEIKRLKKLRSESHQPNYTWKDQIALSQAKHNATVLYLVRAHARGRTHECKSWPPGNVKKLIESALPKYLKPDSVEIREAV